MEKTWFPIIRRPGESVLMVSYILTAYQDPYHQEILLLPRGVYDTKYLAGLVIIEANDFGAFEASMTDRISPEYLAFFISRCRHEADSLLRIAREIRSSAPYDSLINTDLLVLFSRYSSQVIRLMPFLFGIVTLEGVLQKKLQSDLDLAQDAAGNLNLLLFPKEQNIPSLAIVDLFKLAAEAQSNPGLRQLFDLEPAAALEEIEDEHAKFLDSLTAYLDKYDFMNMEYYAGRPLAPVELTARIKEVMGDATDRLDRIKRGRKKTEKQIQQLVDTLTLSPELRSHIDSAQTIHYLRQYRADALFKAGRDLMQLMRTIAGRLNTDYDAIIALTWSEISESLIRGQMVVDSDIVSARQSEYGALLVDGEYSFVTGDELAREFAALPTEKKEEITELVGEVAFPGRHRGRVAIVTTYADIEKVQHGDVLVSAMTDPYYVPAMVRAGAIVTDEGGILSHAAIISRELSLPCIVGTRAATSLLKDGVTVNVDASGAVGRVTVLEE